MIKSLLTVFVVLLVVVNADIWSNCGNSADKFQISSVQITPDPPKKGSEFTVAVSGTLSETVTGGSAKIDVKYGFITVFNKAENICQENSPLPCPIAAGPLSKTISATIPSNAPSGTYKANVVVTDSDNNQIACVNVDLKL